MVVRLESKPTITRKAPSPKMAVFYIMKKRNLQKRPISFWVPPNQQINIR